MPTLSGPALQPPPVPLITGDPVTDIKIIISYLNGLIAYLSNHVPTVEAP